MEIVELDDQRYMSCVEHHLSRCRDYFFIFAIIDYETYNFLIWPGGEIKLFRALSNKRLGRIKTKPVKLAKDMIRCVVGKIGSSKSNRMNICGSSDDYWTLSYNPSINVRTMDEIMRILQRLKIGGA